MEMILAAAAIVISILAAAFALCAYIGTTRRGGRQTAPAESGGMPRFDSRLATLEAFNTLQREALDPLLRLMPAEIRETVNHPTSQQYMILSSYLARIEYFCVGVNTGAYDEEIACRLACGSLDGKTILDRITPILEQTRQNAAEDPYENLRKVLARLSEKRGTP